MPPVACVFVDTLARTAADIRSSLRAGELEALAAIAGGQLPAPYSQRAAAVGVLRLLAADNDRRAVASTSAPALPGPGPATGPASAGFSALAAEAEAAWAEECRWQRFELGVFGVVAG